MDRRGPTLGKSDAAAGRLLGEYTAAGAALKEYVWLDDTLVAILGAHAGTDHQYVLTDHLGTPRAVARPDTHAIVWRWSLSTTAFGDHAPLGNPDGDAHTYTLNLRYPGQYFDAESGLHYNYFRDYEPGTGRYVQSDPIGLAGGMNTYSYVSGSPLGRSDQYGLLDIWIGGANDDTSKIVSDYRSAFQRRNPLRHTEYFDWTQRDAVLDAVSEALVANPCEKINLIGHSLGGALAWDIARELRERGIAADLLVTIDPVGRLPANSFSFPPTAHSWVNVNADWQSYSWLNGDLWATLGGKWGNTPDGSANTHINAPFSHEDFRRMMEYPAGGRSALDRLRKQNQFSCSCNGGGP